MAAWHRSRGADLGLRALGLGLCAISYFTIARLFAMAHPSQSANATAYLLAAIGCLAASAGGAMTVLGNHLFDEIDVSPRWRHHAAREDKEPDQWPISNQ